MLYCFVKTKHFSSFNFRDKVYILYIVLFALMLKVQCRYNIILSFLNQLLRSIQVVIFFAQTAQLMKFDKEFEIRDREIRIHNMLGAILTSKLIFLKEYEECS